MPEILEKLKENQIPIAIGGVVLVGGVFLLTRGSSSSGLSNAIPNVGGGGNTGTGDTSGSGGTGSTSGSGSTGNQGIPGIQGPPGVTGPTGAKGNPGSNTPPIIKPPVIPPIHGGKLPIPVVHPPIRRPGITQPARNLRIFRPPATGVAPKIAVRSRVVPRPSASHVTTRNPVTRVSLAHRIVPRFVPKLAVNQYGKPTQSRQQ